MPLLSDIRFGSLAVYSPRDNGRYSVVSRNLCHAVKQDQFLTLGGQHVRAISRMVQRLGEKIAGSALEPYFSDGPVLVPAPRSSPVKPDSLYPARLICEELAGNGFGSEVRVLLHRTHAVRKAATAGPGERPTARNHYDSLRVDRELLTPGSIMVVDDVITTGSMLIACVSRLKEIYPRAAVRAFGLIRTQSSGEVTAIYDLAEGEIILRSGRCQRNP
jgi:predicted amidophosphoribosyltransferase